MTEQMYKLEREGRDVDYLHVKGDRVIVTSGMLKRVWEDPAKCHGFPDCDSHICTFQTYYGMDKGEVLKNAELIWAR